MTKTKKAKIADPRHSIVRRLLATYWQRENPIIPSLPWGPADAGALGRFLKDNPTVTPEVVGVCLDNRLQSDDHASGERVFVWINDVLRYAAGPLNQYKRPKHVSAEASVGMYRPGKKRSEPVPDETTRQFMGEEWFTRACAHLKSHPVVLTEIERQCLREEGML